MMAISKSKNTDAITLLLEVMSQLRDPNYGCSWDCAQTHQSIAAYSIEEAYELYDALLAGEDRAIRDELGDLLLQVVFHAQIAQERKAFDFDDVANAIAQKMIRRHPHIFSQNAKNPDATSWEDIKQKERIEKNLNSILDDIPLSLPALTRSLKLQKRAARVGFDWDDVQQVLDKLHEETQELVEARTHKSHADICEEFGDMMFVMVNISRHLDIDPEDALRAANRKFTRRFRYIETKFNNDQEALKKATIQELEKLWIEAKNLEKTPK